MQVLAFGKTHGVTFNIFLFFYYSAYVGRGVSRSLLAGFLFGTRLVARGSVPCRNVLFNAAVFTVLQFKVQETEPCVFNTLGDIVLQSAIWHGHVYMSPVSREKPGPLSSKRVRVGWDLT